MFWFLLGIYCKKILLNLRLFFLFLFFVYSTTQHPIYDAFSMLFVCLWNSLGESKKKKNFFVVRCWWSSWRSRLFTLFEVKKGWGRMNWMRRIEKSLKRKKFFFYNFSEISEEFWEVKKSLKAEILRSKIFMFSTNLQNKIWRSICDSKARRKRKGRSHRNALLLLLKSHKFTKK